ncbi:CoA transferase subunit A [Bradyrhizobium sp. U87765 SZCCT0131]|uniref:CoA transferase subunit A n=1 Tax=unclassified Bradyrhizobium TaxID=2631580 RepID=UPI001BAA6D7B|nr:MULTISPECIES: CoA-transferase [unclassified Bradyrhizobium]MBR1217990.1 CoA transferase subunit A [Bradyrhizobium sp. U87765 SZCCT0131]MBR1261064.1 CoA transferase subunit A [Bradyrhizobium sp. U87765 SZCCT0134]MBR1303488.1 CoA transferase subunit A [Bradyrhizobium sp. U87765 SZCCT0110]MBR1319094.1 CoA transferase subunit A [Bradyrhizobium sp. U87765 SZCCT0109]MBR1347419.1 CoA transferase subunit A [Bradyrhizobium sp. U87765 SZCCT0048]
MNKEMDLKSVVGQLRDGMTIGVAGWGPRRKPMALIREILRSDLRDLTIVAYGGPEVGMLCAAGKVKKLVYGFVSLDAMPIEPYFRKAREAGVVQVSELDEGLLQLGLQAAGHNLPFAATRVGLGSDVMKYNPDFKTVTSPYQDGTVLLAMPAIKLDVALIHTSRADRLGNTQTDGPDPFFDALFARAAGKVFVTTEVLVDRIDAEYSHLAKQNLFERCLVTGVVQAPLGAHPTASHDAYGWDMDHFRAYAASAGEDGGWQRYFDQYVEGGEAGYTSRVGGEAKIRALPLPIF